MAWYDSLLQMGYVPAGMTPKAVVTPGGEPGHYKTDMFSTIARALDQFNQKLQLDQQKKMEETKKTADMYNTLREAGYDSERAHRAVMKMEFPKETPGTPLAEQKTRADISKTEADVGESKAREGYYKAQTEQVVTGNKKTLRDRILKKIADGEPLTPGEQRIYDEVIKKESTLDLATILGGGAEKDNTPVDDLTTPTQQPEYVPMLKPDGTAVKVHKDDVQKALLKGYTRR